MTVTASQTLAGLSLTRDQLRAEDRDAFDAFTAFGERIAAILAANDGQIICPRFGRPAFGWPLRRRGFCNVEGAMSCLRDPEVVLADIARRAAARSVRVPAGRAGSRS